MAISLSAPQFQPGQIRAQMPKLAIILLVLVVAWLLARLTWQVLEIFQAPAQIESAGPIRGVATQAPGAQFNWDSMPIFGKAKVEGTQTARQEAAKPKAPAGALKNLNVTVLGIVASSDPQHSYVVIRDRNEARVMRSGEEIRDGISIKEIETRAFIATDGEADKRFELEMLGEGSALSADDTDTQSSSTTEQRTNDSGAELPPVNFRVTNPRVLENLEEYRLALTENPMELLGKIRTQPVPRDGQTYGFRLYPGRDRTLLTGVGLRPGDILLSVNDNSITDLTQLETIIDSLSQSNTIQLKIERGGKVRDINVVLEN
jgi:general secretion pathway protein C